MQGGLGIGLHAESVEMGEDGLLRRGVLIRHFDAERIKEYNRITIGTPEQMDRLVEEIKAILEDRK